MTKQKSAVAAALAACLLTLSGVAAAQYTTPGSQTGASPPMAPPAKTTAAPDQAPATTQAPAAATPSMGAQGTTPAAGNQQPTGRMGIPSKSDSAATAFKTLDPTNRGYITKAEADKIPGFMGFDNADTNRDGQLSYDEFTTAWKTYSGQ